MLGMAERDHEALEVFHSHSLAAGDIQFSTSIRAQNEEKHLL